MAQKREKEETEIKVPENLQICTLTQTIPSSPQIPAARLPEIPDPTASDSCELRTSSAGSPENPDLVSPAENPDLVSSAEIPKNLKRPREVTRCSGSGCRKRVGLMGFQCRCGDVFCSEHRYSDRHDCSYDYKAAGREAIARENPVVRAAKLVKV
ncbi:switch-activating protein Sap1 [Orobanche hederae]